MLIDKLLSGAVRLWLQSQVSQVNNLQIEITGKDRQIIQGKIPQLIISATDVVYQELHLSKLQIIGTTINFNLPEILRGKPLQLLEPIVVKLEVLCQEKDLQNSLSSPLLAAGLTDIWSRFLNQSWESWAMNYEGYQWHYLSLSEAEIFFKGTFAAQQKNNLIGIKTGVKLKDFQTLLLSPVEIITIPELPINTNKTLIFDLGTQVTITQLNLTQEHLLLQGTITIFPEAN